MNKKMLATLPFALLASIAEAQMDFGPNFGDIAMDYGFAYFPARFFGLFLLVIGLMVLIRKDQKAHFDQLVESKEFLFITGLVTVILGALIVAINNIWRFDWRLLITILGWATLIKGAMVLMLPEFSVSLWRNYRLNNGCWLRAGG